MRSAPELMLFGVFGFLSFVLGFYSNVAIAWIGAVVADLIANKPLLKVSPSYAEFKRAHLYQINPVGFGSTMVGGAVSVPAFFGAFGPFAQAFSPYLALGVSFVLSPVLALATRGEYYVVREGSTSEILEGDETRYATRTCGRRGHGELHLPRDGHLLPLPHPGERLLGLLQETHAARQETRGGAGLRRMDLAGAVRSAYFRYTRARRKNR